MRLKGKELSDVAEFCNNFPAIEMQFKVLGEPRVSEAVQVVFHLQRDDEGDEDAEDASPYGRVCAPLYPKAKREAYWIVIGDREADRLLSIKRVVMSKRQLSVKLELEFETAGSKKLTSFLMSDSYAGCDQGLKWTCTLRRSSSSGGRDMHIILLVFENNYE